MRINDEMRVLRAAAGALFRTTPGWPDQPLACETYENQVCASDYAVLY
jgi:hypothetical protein